MTDTHIKINDVTPRVQYTGNNSTTEFPYAFPIFDETNMQVYLNDTLIDPDATITIGEGDDAVDYPVYTVTGVGEDDGGKVIFTVAPETGVLVTLVRNVPIERVTDFQEGGSFRPKNINDDLDRQTAFCQQLQETLSRCVKVGVTSTSDPSEILPMVEALYDDLDNIDTVAEISEDVETVSQNISDVSNCSTNMSAIQDAPTQASNAANSATAAAASAASAAISAAGTKFKLFHHDWFDYELNDMAWLRADTYSWQDGTVYSVAYNHLVDDIEGKAATTETVDGTTVTYYLADDGHKIVDVADVSAIETVYNSTGVAWYYVLDTTNQRFKLPRENPAREELIQVIRAKGNEIALGFTDGTDTGGLYRMQMSNLSGSATLLLDKGSYGSATGQTATQDRTWGSSFITAGLTTDSTKSGIISSMTDSTSVYKGNKYLYFFVGQYTQTATEQTAGLNTELFNGKMDLDMSNMNPSQTAKQTIIRLSEPDWSAGVDIEVPVQATPYVCPSDGIYCFCFMPASSQSNLFVNGVKTAVCMRNSSSNNANKASSSAVLQKNDSIYFDVGTTTANTFASTFYPLKGVTNA